MEWLGKFKFRHWVDRKKLELAGKVLYWVSQINFGMDQKVWVSTLDGLEKFRILLGMSGRKVVSRRSDESE